MLRQLGGNELHYKVSAIHIIIEKTCIIPRVRSRSTAIYHN